MTNVSIALSLSSINVDAKGNSAVITWNTDENATSRIDYGSAGYTRLIVDNNKKFNHSVTLKDLAPKTRYIYRITSSGLSGYAQNSSNFETTDEIPPDPVENLSSNTGIDFVKLSWNPSNITDFSRYNIYREEIKLVSIETITLTEFTDSGLSQDTEYSYGVSVVDNSSNEGEIKIIKARTKVPDTIAPLITNLTITDLQDTSASLSWQTDEASSSRVNYGTSQDFQPENSILILKRLIKHNATLNNLTNNTKYFYSITACDSNLNCANSTIKEFTTGEDTSPVFVNFSLPKYWNQAGIEIPGNTKSFSTVKLYSNGLLNRFVKTDIRGIFNFKNVKLKPGVNTITLEAKDKLGNQINKTLNTTVDLISPDISLVIPAKSKENRMILSGTVSKKARIQFFVDSSSDNIPPGQVKAIKNGTITDSSTTIKWGSVSDPDIRGYIIYRSDLGPIAFVSESATQSTTQSTNQLTNQLTTQSINQYDDAQFEPSTNYIYQVSAIDRHCNLGPRSPELRLKTHANATKGKSSAAVKIELPDCFTAQKEFESEGSFTVELALQEGNNNVKVIATDAAGNTDKVEGAIWVDTKAPTILENNLVKITPTYTLDINVVGKVDEQALVNIYLNDEEKPSFSGKTDDQGNFNIPVMLDRKIDSSFDITRNRPFTNTGTPGTAPGAVSASSGIDLSSVFTTNIKIIAVDNTGLSSNPVSSPVEFKICGQGGDWIIQPTEIFPKELVPRFIIDGVAQVGFTLNLSWAGAGQEQRIKSIRSLVRQDLSPQEREKWDVDWVQISQPTNPDFKRLKATYVQLQVRQPNTANPGNKTLLQREQELAEHNKKNCKLGVGCVRVPLIIEIDYDQPNAYYLPQILPNPSDVSSSNSAVSGPNSITPVSRSYTQKQCLDLEVVIQPRIPPKFLPKGMLEAMVKLLDGVIGGIDGILKILEPATKFVLVGCLLSWVVLFFKKATEFTSCSGSALGGGTDFAQCSCPKGECKKVKNNQVTSEKDDNCQVCYDAKKSTLEWQINSQWLCDRVFCPAVPSINKYARDFGSDLPVEVSGNQVASGSNIKSDCSNQGYSQFTGKYDANNPGEQVCSAISLKPQGGYNNACCEEEYLRNWKTASLGIDPLKRSECLAQGKDAGECGGWGSLYEGAASLSLCKPEKQNEIFYGFDAPNSNFVVRLGEKEKTESTNAKGEKITQEKYKKGKEPTAYLATIYRQGELIDPKSIDQLEKQRADAIAKLSSPNADRSSIMNSGADTSGDLYSKVSQQEAQKQGQEGNLRITKTIVTKGKEILKFDNQCEICFDVTKNPKDRATACNECKCYACQFQEKSENDWIEKIDPKKTKEQCIYDSPISKDKQPIPTPIVNAVCQGGSGQDYIIDPTDGLLRSIQTGCMTAITSYLQQYKQMLEIIRTCFKTILVTGDGSAGVCRATLSIYVCDLIYNALRCVTQNPGTGFGSRAQGLGGFFSHLTKAGSEIQEGVANRYGSTNLYRVMFVERKLFNAACISFFTGTSGIDWDGMIKQTVRIPIKSIVVVSPATRRFNSFNAINGVATHIYRVGLLVVAGSDVNYQVDLVCSQDSSCDPREGFDGGMCDCALKGKEMTMPASTYFAFDGTRSKSSFGSNILSGSGTNTLIAGDALNKEQFVVISTPGFGDVRYDKVRVTYVYRDSKGDLKKEILEQKIIMEGDLPPRMCRFENNIYTCQLYNEGVGIAAFKSFKGINLYLGKDITQMTLFKSGTIPQAEISIQKQPGPDVCLYITMMNEQGQIVSTPKSYQISDIGETKKSYEFPNVPYVKPGEFTITARVSQGQIAPGISASGLSSDSIRGDYTFSLDFEDKSGTSNIPDGKITIDANSKDTVNYDGKNAEIKILYDVKAGGIILKVGNTQPQSEILVRSVTLVQGQKQALFTGTLKIGDKITSANAKYLARFDLRGMDKEKKTCDSLTPYDVVRFNNQLQQQDTFVLYEPGVSSSGNGNVNTAINTGTGSQAPDSIVLEKNELMPGETTKATLVNPSNPSAKIEWSVDKTAIESKNLDFGGIALIDKTNGEITAISPGSVKVIAKIGTKTVVKDPALVIPRQQCSDGGNQNNFCYSGTSCNSQYLESFGSATCTGNRICCKLKS